MMVNWAQKGPIGNVQGVPKKLQIKKNHTKIECCGAKSIKMSHDDV